jgi:membrane protein DedA with SNARE-associated domain
VSGLVEHYGLLALFLIVMLESLGVPLPGETALVAAGVFASRGRLDIAAVIAVAATLVSYYAGQAAADAIARYGLIGGVAIAGLVLAGLVGFHFWRKRLVESP